MILAKINLRFADVTENEYFFRFRRTRNEYASKGILTLHASVCKYIY